MSPVQDGCFGVLSVHHLSEGGVNQEGFLLRWISCLVSEGSLKASGDDGSSRECCLKYCVTVMDGVVKHLPSGDGLCAVSLLGGSAVIPPTDELRCEF